MAELTASAGLVRGLLDFAARCGADRRALAASVGLGESALEDPDARVGVTAYVNLLRQASIMCGDPALALRYGEAIDMSEVSIVGLLMNASETMADALVQLQRFNRLALEVEGDDQRFSLTQRHGGMWIADSRLDPNESPQLTEVAFARLVCGPRRFLPEPHVLEIHVTYPAPSYAAEYDSVFQCKTVFESDWNAMRLHPQISSWRVALQPRYVFGVLMERADRLLEQLDDAKTLRGRVESLVLAILHRGEANADAIAQTMGFSRQTLFRRLKDEGVTFEQVLDDLRRRMALHYLHGKAASIDEIAYLVGFSDRASFSRAFKRWTGQSPGQVRADMHR